MISEEMCEFCVVRGGHHTDTCTRPRAYLDEYEPFDDPETGERLYRWKPGWNTSNRMKLEKEADNYRAKWEDVSRSLRDLVRWAEKMCPDGCEGPKDYFGVVPHDEDCAFSEVLGNAKKLLDSPESRPTLREAAEACIADPGPEVKG